MGAVIDGQPVVVTGAGGGIGAALASVATKRGASVVVVCDVDVASAESVAEEITARGGSAVARSCDVSLSESMDALADSVIGEFGQPALVCANAGVIGTTVTLLDCDPADAAWVLGVNTLGVFHTLRSFGRRMAQSPHPGWFLVTASEHALGVPHLRAGMYTASKHAVLGMCDVMRGELPAHLGITVACPGLTSSRLWNATGRRPDRFGGASDVDPRGGALMQHAGMPAGVVAERAIDGASAGHFIVATHYNAREYAERRADEIADAFDRLQPIDTTNYDVGRLVAQAVRRPEA